MILSPLLQQVQIGLFIISGMLGVGVLFGLMMGAQSVSEEISPLATGGASSEEKTHPNEQRRTPRTKCDMLMELMDKTQSTGGVGRLLNISPMGACFESTSIYLKDDTIIAQLPTMRKGANKISGRVVWLRSRPGNTLYGIRLNPATRA